MKTDIDFADALVKAFQPFAEGIASAELEKESLAKLNKDELAMVLEYITDGQLNHIYDELGLLVSKLADRDKKLSLLKELIASPLLGDKVSSIIANILAELKLKDDEQTEEFDLFS